MTSYDYIIVGSGSSGGFLALRLSENPQTRILILEAGPSDKHWTTRIPAGNRFTFGGGLRTWSFETEPEPFMNDRRLDQPRGKTLGGSSSLNGMVYVRGNRQDYDAWEAGGAKGWGYEDVLPFFKSIETWDGQSDLRGASGPIHVRPYSNNHPIEQAFIEAGVEAGHPAPDDYNGSAQEGVCSFDANIRNGVRSGTGRECMEPVMKRSNVTVLTDAIATKVILENGRACGIAYRHQGQEQIAQTDGEVLLSAGAFQSPQLLMLSGIGPADHLREHGLSVLQDLPGVGQNLQDHLEVHMKHRSPHKGIGKNKYLKKHRMLMAGIQWYLTHTGPAASGPSRVGGFFRSSDAEPYPDIQFHFWPYYLEGWSPPPDKDGYCFDVGPVRSGARGWVKLRSADPFATPRILLNGLSDPNDLPRFRAAIAIARDIAAQTAFNFCRGPEVSPGPEVTSDTDLDDYIRANANSAYHPCGTCKIGTDDMAVVDSHGRVHGVDGLRVADASIMPLITNGNINAPALMIGEKIAHHVIMGDT